MIDLFFKLIELKMFGVIDVFAGEVVDAIVADSKQHANFLFEFLSEIQPQKHPIL